MKTKIYISPKIEKIDVTLERGIALSIEDGWDDDGGFMDNNGNPITP